ncbi:MAG: YgiQ family radical SAM protein, partial [Thermoguttaceae bacterium]|nr:YgiQ family radical SAM protein [Thermoguttaceae bacterium]
MTASEVARRHWQEVDFVLVTGDPYIDHPAILAARVARSLEAAGFRVAILARPSTRRPNDWTRFGRPRLAFLVTSGQ